MKTLLLLLIGCAASAVAQTATLPYDRLGRDNVTMRLEASSGNIARAAQRWGYRAEDKSIEVSISPIGANSAPVLVEFYVIVKPENFVPFARLVERQQAESGAAKKCRFELGKFGGMDIKGWVVRAVRDNRVVGYVASAYEYEKFATDSSLLEQWVAQRAAVKTEQEQRRYEKYRQRYGAN